MGKPRLSHIGDKGEARMVDVSDKPATARTAVAEGFIAMAPATLALLESGETPKGDVIATARIAGHHGRQAHARADPAVPCTQLDQGLHRSRVYGRAAGRARDGRGQDIRPDRRRDGGVDRGIGACLTLYDMLKAVDRAMRIGGIRVLEKAGGRSGHYRAEANAGKGE